MGAQSTCLLLLLYSEAHKTQGQLNSLNTVGSCNPLSSWYNMMRALCFLDAPRSRYIVCLNGGRSYATPLKQRLHDLSTIQMNYIANCRLCGTEILGPIPFTVRCTQCNLYIGILVLDVTAPILISNSSVLCK